MRWLLFLATLSACGAASGGPAFSPTYPDNVDEAIQAVLTRLRTAPPNDDEPAVAAGVTDDELMVVDLRERRLLWRQAVVSPVSAPRIAGELVLLHERSGIVARDLRSGAIRFTQPDEALYLAGADGEGERTVLSLTTGGGVGARSKIVLARAGHIVWTKSIDYAAGAPALAAGMVFIPWATQNLSILDADTGEELARVRIADTVIGRAFRQGNSVYFGQRGLFRLTASITGGRTEAAAYFEPQLPEFPGDPPFMVDPYQPAPAPSSALHRVRYAWHAAGEGDEVRLADDNLYAIFYRVVFALDPAGDSVRWVYVHERDIVGAQGQAGGLLIADADGGFTRLSAHDGLPHWSHDADTTALAASLRAEGFAPDEGPQGQAAPLRDQLLAAAHDPDARLVPARVLATRMLAALPEAEATGHLIALCDDRRAPPPVKTAACEALAERTTGSELVLEALERHARFLAQTTAPPVGALARAAVHMQAREAVPLLLSHVRDPATEAPDLAPLIDAIAALGDRSALEPLRDFLRLYHAEATDDALVAAVGAAADALVALEGASAAETIEPLAEDPLAPEPARARLRATLSALAAEEEQGEEPPSDGEGEATTDDGATDAATDERPERIDAAVVARTLDPVQAELRACLRQDSEGARAARLVLRIGGDGTLQHVSVSPRRLAGCIEPIVRRARFPASRRNVNEQVTYRVRR